MRVMNTFGALTARIYAFFNRNPASNRVVLELADLTPDDRALEVGCGPGAAVEAAAALIGGERVAAVDPSETFVDMVRRRVPGADVRVSGAEDVPFPDGSFTVIWSIASMHHWTDRDAGLKTLSAKLATPGRLLIAERLLRRAGHGITRGQAADVTAQLKRLGFTDVRTIERQDKRRTFLVLYASR